MPSPCLKHHAITPLHYIFPFRGSPALRVHSKIKSRQTVSWAGAELGYYPSLTSEERTLNAGSGVKGLSEVDEANSGPVAYDRKLVSSQQEVSVAPPAKSFFLVPYSSFPGI